MGRRKGAPFQVEPGFRSAAKAPNFPNAKHGIGAVPPLKSVDSQTESWRLEVAEEGTGEEGRGGGREGGSRPTLGQALKRILDGRRASVLFSSLECLLGASMIFCLRFVAVFVIPTNNPVKVIKRLVMGMTHIGITERVFLCYPMRWLRVSGCRTFDPTFPIGCPIFGRRPLSQFGCPKSKAATSG